MKEAADGILVGFYPVLQEPQTNIPNRNSAFRPGAGRLPVPRWVFANCQRRFQHLKQQMRKKKKKKRPVSQRRKSQRANPGRPQRTRRDSNGKMCEWRRESVSVRLLLAEGPPPKRSTHTKSAWLLQFVRHAPIPLAAETPCFSEPVPTSHWLHFPSNSGWFRSSCLPEPPRETGGFLHFHFPCWKVIFISSLEFLFFPSGTFRHQHKHNG